MTLKQHNDIVQKLLKKLDQKESEITTLKKQLQKSQNLIPASSSYKSPVLDPQSQPSTQKLTLLQKQHKQKLTALTQQLASKTIQNKDLQTKLTALKNIEAKQKQHAMEIMKKINNIIAYDSKVAAVVKYYEEILVKNKENIKKFRGLAREYWGKLRKYQEGEVDNLQEILGEDEDESQDQNQENIDHKKGSNNSIEQSKSNNGNTHTKYQQQITKQKSQLIKYQKLYEQKSNQFKSLTKKYSDLTKQYYRVINQYGQKDKTVKMFKKQSNNNNLQDRETQRGGKGKYTNGYNGNNQGKFDGLLQQMLNNFQNQNSSNINTDNSLSYSFLSNYNKIQPQNSKNSLFSPNINTLNSINDQKQLQFLQSLINQITQLLNIQNRIQIIPKLTKITIKLQQNQLFQNIVRDFCAMLYRLGFGKVPVSQIKVQLQKLEKRIQKYAENADLLDEICIEIGSKKQKLIQKIRDMKATQQQFFKNMKDINFMQKLPKANKISQFIQYFQLDAEICQLPEQLKKMYDQLKYIDKFIKQSSLILGRQSQGLEKSLEQILRYLERKQAEKSLKKPQKHDRGHNKNNH